MATINLNSILSETVDITNSVITESVTSKPLPDFDVILQEWSYRCDSGYPTIGKKSDMIHLQAILEEMEIENPYPKVKMTEAPAITVDAAHWKQVFGAENINRLYPKHGKEIMQIFMYFIQMITDKHGQNL